MAGCATPLVDVSPREETGADRAWSNAQGGVMRNALVLGLASAIFVGACAAAPSGSGSPTSAPSNGLSSGESIVVRTRMAIADAPGSEPTATGKVLEGSTLGGETFCAAGTIRDSHASLDPAVDPLGLLDR